MVMVMLRGKSHMPWSVLFGSQNDLPTNVISGSTSATPCSSPASKEDTTLIVLQSPQSRLSTNTVCYQKTRNRVRGYTTYAYCFYFAMNPWAFQEKKEFPFRNLHLVMKISFIFSLLFLIIHVGMMVEQQVVSKGGNSS